MAKKEKKDHIKVDVETFAQIALALRDALETMEAELEEAGFALDDFEEYEEEEEGYSEEEEEEEEEEPKKKKN
jgi:hypothetical protein